jgi:A/G-specific adenine glycosylase
VDFASALLNWYDHNARVLPWRSLSSPYRTWISEIMLQQTQVGNVIPYFERFMQGFPDLESLASATQSEVLSLWEGLGYYSRARNLHKAAQVVMAECGGVLPSTSKELMQLPGIGRYTAGAIASIAFGQSEPALDGNIRRVFSRLLELEEPLKSSSSERLLWDFARRVCPKQRVGDFNQALMDLGAAICRPGQPLCPQCPISSACQAFQHGTQNQIPVVIKKPPIPHYIVTAAVILQDGLLLIQQRPQKGLLAGLWEFPGGKLEESDVDLVACLEREIGEEIGVKIVVGNGFGVYKHAYTHFRITLHAFLCQLEAGQQIPVTDTLRWVQFSQLADFAMGKVDRQIADNLNKLKSEG